MLLRSTIVQRMWDTPPNSTWPQKHPHAHSDFIHDHRRRKRPFIDHVNTAPTPQHLQTCLRTGKEIEAQSHEERCPSSHSKFMALSGLEQSSVNSTPASYHLPWVTPGFLRKGHIRHTPTALWPQVPRPQILAQAKDHVYPSYSDSNNTKCLQHWAGFSVFSFYL